MSKVSSGGKRRNSYDFIRLIAATFVVFSHSFALSGNAEPMLGSGVSLGTLGVWVFFILSGYLIAISWDQYPRFNIFFAKRSLRIFPGLIVNTLLSIAILGIVFSSIPAREFMVNQGAIDYLKNIFLYDLQSALPGVFTDNIHSNSVNGSLWTLRYEFTMYVAVALIGALGIYKKIKPAHIWIGLFVIELIILAIGSSHFSFEILYLKFDRLVYLALLFFSGVMAYKYSDRIELTYKAGLVSLITFILGAIVLPKFVILFGAVFLAYAIFALGKSAMFSGLGKIGDLSYGIYIYSFPVQQALYAATGQQNAMIMFAWSYIISVTLAYASWRLIEKPSLLLKTKLRVDRYPLRQTDGAW